jgi:hypothetical protein
VRALVGVGNYAYPSGPNTFYLNSEPLMGANPPKPQKRSPLQTRAPCENQQPPDLRTRVAPPPPGFPVKNDTPAALALRERSKDAATHWVRALLAKQGLDRLVHVSNGVLTKAEIPKLRKALP